MSTKSLKPITIVMVDDHQLVRIGLRSVLETLPDLELIGEADTGREGVRLVTELKPVIVLLDVRLADCNGIEICRDILSECPGTRVLFLTSYGDAETIFSAVLAGAQGYILKDSSPTALIEGIRTVASGQSLLDPKVTTEALSLIRTQQRGTRTKGFGLSPQEERVLKLVALGKTNKEIASDLGLSDKTVKNYLANVYDKLHVSRRSQATAVFLRGEETGLQR